MKKSREFIVTQIIAHLVCGIAAILALAPFLLLIIGSFTDDTWATTHGFSFFPEAWSLQAYQYIAGNMDTIGRGYVNTIIVTAVGTTLSVSITTMYGYVICQKHIPGAKILSFLLIFTMLFGGGLVASYYIYSRVIGITDTIWALIIPGFIMGAFNVILVRNYCQNSIPISLIEAARLDGAGEFAIFLKVVVPLSVPIIATIALTTGLGYWNDWTNGLYYLSLRGGSHLMTIQVILNNIVENINALLQGGSATTKRLTKMPGTTIRIAIAVVGILPVLVIYPIFQKYFVKGITLGGVKE